MISHKERREKRKALIEDFKKGIDIDNLVECYNLTKNTILNYLYMAGYNVRFSHERKAKRREGIIKDYKAGISISDISIKYGISIGTVEKYLKGTKKSDKGKIGQEMRRKMLELFTIHKDTRTIADKLGVSTGYVLNTIGKEMSQYRKDRDVKIIETLKNTEKPLADIAEEYNMSITHIKRLDKSTGIDRIKTKPKNYPDMKKIVAVIADIINTDEELLKISEKHNMQEATLHRIKGTMIECGIPFKQRKRGQWRR